MNLVSRILYTETWVDDKKVSSVKTGDYVEYRVIFEITIQGSYTIELTIQGGETVQSGPHTLQPGTYFVRYRWVESRSAGRYTATVKLYEDSTLIDTKTFEYTVVGPTPLPLLQMPMLLAIGGLVLLGVIFATRRR